MPHRHCNDFTRTGMLRAAAARAGNGLPQIEPGMPVPAGTGLSRRSFLLRSAGLALSVYGASKLNALPGLESGVAHAASGPAQPVLVSVFLEGGIDTLSVLAPVGDDRYRKLRPKLALPESAGPAFSEDPRLHWHPSAQALAALHAEGKVSVMPAIGYDHPDQSHFNSRHFYEVGSLDRDLRTGWMGRYLDHVGTADNPLQGLALDGRLAPSLATGRVPVAAIDNPADYGLWGRGIWGDIEPLMLDAVADLGAAHTGSPDAAMRQAGAVAAQVGRLRQQLVPFQPVDEDTPAFTSPVAYPQVSENGQFPERLAALAALLGAGLPLRCVTLNAPGDYDTHDDQADDLSAGLKLTCESLLAFQRDLEARGLADRVLVHVWSEFGRRAEENGSAGTDHGAAGLGLVIGSRAAGRMIGEFPGLRHLDKDGNLRATADFRGLYAALLEQWLGADPGAVIPGAAKFKRPRIVK